jgi:menaquinone-dependent protoporphyrinogen oxidase
MTVLVAYASKHGSTAGIAEGIAERLRERGKDMDVRAVSDVDGLGDVEAIVLGSAVYMGSWMKEASGFVERHRDELARLPVWLFSSGPTGTEPTEVGPSDKQVEQLVEAVHPRDHHVFSGAIDPGKLGFVERRIVRAVKAPTGDFRDWHEIGSYADAIADAL